MDTLTMANATSYNLPPLPSYTLTPRPSLIPGISDVTLQLLAPIVVYWVISGFFQVLDSFDLCAEYRLHTPAELTRRNHVTKYEVLRDVILQQIIQTIFGYAMAYFDPPEMIGREEYDIAVWAQRLRRVEMQLPRLLAILGVDAPKLATQLYNRSPSLAGALAGGQYGFTGFASWELIVGKSIYLVAIPFVQFTVAIIMEDTWQYFLHRGMHMNKFLYTWLHSRHHRLYVPYAFGALYNHPIEGFLLDTMGAGIAYLATGMTVRQGLVFFTCSTIKTVDDHCGYCFPWDPLQHITSNNAAYHDVHHQSWGVKSNFSQPFFTFWDRFLGTTWTGGDVSARYEKAKIAAQKKVDADKAATESSILNSPATDTIKAQQTASASRRQMAEDGLDDPAVILAEEAREERQAAHSIIRPSRRKQSSFDAKSFSEKVSGSLYGRGTPILHTDVAR